MARILAGQGQTRLVIKGNSGGPTEMHAEYRVYDGDLRESPKRLNFDGTDFTSPASKVWKDALATVKVEEGIK